MSLAVGVLSTAHVHAPSFTGAFTAHPEAHVVGVWDDDAARGRAFTDARGLTFQPELGVLLRECDAVVICSENMKHASLVKAAAEEGVHVLCEKPIAPDAESDEVIASAWAKADKVFMTAFPCPFSPSFAKLKKGVEAGEIGRILALCTTNRGSCPGGWFVDKSLSGGGAMIDHVVHVADLLRRLLGEDPSSVYAQIGSQMHQQEWDDTAKVSLGFPSGVFATLDSSWSRPKGYKTWGDVMVRAVGEKGVLEANLFAQGVDVYREEGHQLSGTASDMDGLMVSEFLAAIAERREPLTTLHDGLMASRIARAAYRSVESGQPEAP
jgi:predicted dehydrogenase